MLPEHRHVDVREHRPAPAVEALDAGFDAVASVGRRRSVHGPGRVLSDLAVMLADGGARYNLCDSGWKVLTAPSRSALVATRQAV